MIEKLKKLIGQEIGYAQLCDAIGAKRKTGNAKKAQLRNLAMYCDIQEIGRPTKYLITEVYAKEAKAFAKINGNNKYQIMFDAVVYQAFLENGGRPIYASTTDLLRLFSEVNENFAYACDSWNMKMLGDDFTCFSAMGLIAKKILIRWTRDRLNNMEARSLIGQNAAYRLYKLHTGNYGSFKTRHDVDINSELGKKCMAIYADAINTIIPQDYRDQAKNKKMWLPLPIYDNLQDYVTKLTRKEFNNEFCDMKQIIALYPPTEEWISERLSKIYGDLPALHEINAEACKKILTSNSKELDPFTGLERKRFIEINIKASPKISLKQELEKARTKERELEFE